MTERKKNREADVTRERKMKAKAASPAIEILEFIDSLPQVTPGDRIIISYAVAHVQAQIGMSLGGTLQQVQEAGKIGVQLAHEIVFSSPNASSASQDKPSCTCAVYSDAPEAEPTKALRAKAAREAKRALARILNTDP